MTLAVYSWVLALQIWHKGSSVPSLGSQLVDEDTQDEVTGRLSVVDITAEFFKKVL